MLNKNETLILMKKVFTQYNNMITSKINSHNSTIANSSQNGHMTSTQASKLDTLESKSIMFTNPTLTGTVTVPSIDSSSADTQAANKKYVDNKSEVVIGTEANVIDNTKILVDINSDATNVLDTTIYQTRNDINLGTTNKNIVGAINEVNSKSITYTLPMATASILGGIKVGTGLSISNGVLSATGSGGITDSIEWDNIQNKPSVFTPAAHNHVKADITDFSHIHSYNDLTDKPTIPTITNDLTSTLKTNYDTAYTHSQSSHAPSTAQKNSDITKAEIEAKLIGSITTHTHTADHTHSNKTILDGLSFTFWSGTLAQYNAITTKSSTTIYFITG